MSLDLGTPDDFRGQPYAGLTNEMSHILCGIAGAWGALRLDVPALVAVLGASLIASAVELWQARTGRNSLHDSLSDIVFVVGGAWWQAADQPALLAGLLAMALVSGVLRRRREARA